MSDTEDIKAKLDIVDLIREYVPVKAVGVNFQAVCPFHNEKTPSFVISPDKQIWHCFGCGRGGDAFSFVMEKEGFDFREALQFLAAKAGVTLKNDNPEKRSRRSRLLEIMALAGRYYAHVLGTGAGSKAKEYLIKRGLKEDTITDWSLGYSPDTWSSLYEFLKERPKTGQKFNDDEIVAAGLVVKKDKASHGHNYYDRFRGRIMFPIFDANNNLVAFTARISPEKEKTEKMGKYINSPQTEIYDKSRILFGLNFAKSAIREQDLAIVVEGQMDVIKYHESGITNVVASSGTALSSNQVLLLKRFTKNVALFFDMDEAGQIANDRGIKELLAQDMSVKIITTPYGKDADEALENNPEEVKADTSLGKVNESDTDFENYYKKKVQNTKPVLEYYFDKISKDLNLDDLDNKKMIRDKMFQMISYVNDKVEQGYWLKKISEDLGFSETDIREEFVQVVNKQKLGQSSPQAGPDEQEKDNFKQKEVLFSREELLSELFLSLIIKFSELFSYGIDNLDISQLQGLRNISFYKTLIIYYNKANSFSYEDFHKSLLSDPESTKLLDRLILLGEKEFYSHELVDARHELIKIIQELKRSGLKKKIKLLEKDLISIEKSGNKEVEKMTQIMTDLKSATDELKKLM